MILKNFPNIDDLSGWNKVVAINSDQLIDHVCPIAQELSEIPDADLNATFACDAFMELTGCEDALNEIFEGKLPYLEFNQINRPAANGTINLLDFKVIPVDERNPQNGAVLLMRNSLNPGTDSV